MTYWNPIDRYGVERFTAELAEAGGAGCILPDLPVAGVRRCGGSTPRSTASPPSSSSRPAARTRGSPTITAAGSGFVYAASLMGVTGTRESVGAQAQDLVRRTRATTDLPVCVGLGVSNAEQAAEVAGFADGVIVGSAFVKRLLDAPDERGRAGRPYGRSRASSRRAYAGRRDGGPTAG